jgi:hypothetical protein
VLCLLRRVASLTPGGGGGGGAEAAARCSLGRWEFARKRTAAQAIQRKARAKGRARDDAAARIIQVR